MLRQCLLCHGSFPLVLFPQVRYKGLYRHRHVCATCYGKRKMLSDASYRAAKSGLEFSLVPEDVVIPGTCPILGIPLSFAEGSPLTSPSLDRIDSSKGYTKDNVQVISTRANHLKRDATIEELIALGTWAAMYHEESTK